MTGDWDPSEPIPNVSTKQVWMWACPYCGSKTLSDTKPADLQECAHGHPAHIGVKS